MKHGAGAATVQQHQREVKSAIRAPPAGSVTGGADHEGAREFMCSACGKGFSTAEELESHITMHETADVR